MAPNHHLNQCWSIVNWTFGNKLLEWNLNRNIFFFIQENALENIFWKMAAILSLPQCVKFILNILTSTEESQRVHKKADCCLTFKNLFNTQHSQWVQWGNLEWGQHLIWPNSYCIFHTWSTLPDRSVPIKFLSEINASLSALLSLIEAPY